MREVQGANPWCGSAARAEHLEPAKSRISSGYSQHEQCMRRRGLLLFAVLCRVYVHP